MIFKLHPMNHEAAARLTTIDLNDLKPMGEYRGSTVLAGIQSLGDGGGEF